MRHNFEVELGLRRRKLLKVLAFKIFVTFRMVLFGIHQRFNVSKKVGGRCYDYVLQFCTEATTGGVL